MLDCKNATNGMFNLNVSISVKNNSNFVSFSVIVQALKLSLVVKTA